MSNHELKDHWFNTQKWDTGDTAWVVTDNGIMKWKRQVWIDDLSLNKFGFLMATIRFADGKTKTTGTTCLWREYSDLPHVPWHEPNPSKEAMQAAWDKA